MSNYGSTGLKQKIKDIIDNLLTENINQSRLDDLLNYSRIGIKKIRKSLKTLRMNIEATGMFVYIYIYIYIYI